MIRSAFRYPGSKEKIAAGVLRWFPPAVNFAYMNHEWTDYVEPFVGCGALAVKILPNLPPTTRVIFGDKDPGIVALWQVVYDDPGPLIKKLLSFTPSAEAFYRFKAED